jgi:hypothetical protein
MPMLQYIFMKNLKRTVLVAGLLMGLGSTLQAITLNSANSIHWFNFASNPTDDQIAAAAGVSLATLGPLIYKAAPDGGTPTADESGLVAANYGTFFAPAAGTGNVSVTWTGGLVADATYFLAKDGDEGSYLWNISAWNGIDTIELTSPFSEGKKFSHIEFFGGTAPGVPDGGSSAFMLGAVLLGLMAFIRRRAV